MGKPYLLFTAFNYRFNVQFGFRYEKGFKNLKLLLTGKLEYPELTRDEALNLFHNLLFNVLSFNRRFSKAKIFDYRKVTIILQLIIQY